MLVVVVLSVGWMFAGGIAALIAICVIFRALAIVLYREFSSEVLVDCKSFVHGSEWNVCAGSRSMGG